MWHNNVNIASAAKTNHHTILATNTGISVVIMFFKYVVANDIPMITHVMEPCVCSKKQKYIEIQKSEGKVICKKGYNFTQTHIRQLYDKKNIYHWLNT